MSKLAQIRIVVFKPNEAPEVEEIPNELEDMQKIVGGYIEVAMHYGKYICICNEEGKLLQLPYNKPIAKDRFGKPADYLAGTVFFTKEGRDGEFASLNERDVEAILELWDRL